MNCQQKYLSGILTESLNRGFIERLLIVAIVFGTASLARAQTPGLRGFASDSTGGRLPGASITATNTETNYTRQTTTGQDGFWLIGDLPAGSWRLTATAPHFRTFVRDGIHIDIHESARIDPVLEPGQQSDSITVHADATAVRTENSESGRTVEPAEIQNLPLVDRNVYTFLNLTPGVTFSTSRENFGYAEQRTLIDGSANAGAGSVAFYLDGGSNIAGLRNTGGGIPNPDAVEEFRVVTSGLQAEYGRFGGGMVDAIVRSGTNSIHGSLFEFLRNNDLSALSYDAAAPSALHRNQFGGVLGGPVRRNKLFYFVSYSGLRQRADDLQNTAIVPSAAERMGDFSSVVTPITNPFSSTKTPFPGNKIPVSLFDPVAVNILTQYLPLPNLPGNFAQVQQAHPLDTDEGLFKADYLLNSRSRFTLSYYATRGSELEPFVGGMANLPWTSQLFDWLQQNANANETFTLSPQTVSQTTLTYLRDIGSRLNSPGISLTDLGSSFRELGPPSLPRIAVSGYFTLGNAQSGPVTGGNYYGLREIITLTRGRHTLKIGGEFSLQKLVEDVSLNNFGIFTFDGSRSGNALSDFLLGAPKQLSQDAPVRESANDWYSALFVQDDFRVRRNFTLNLGLRYDLPTTPTDPQNRKVTFAPGVQSTVVPGAPAGLLFPGDPGVGRGIVSAGKLDFAPRIGFAWDPFGDGKTVVRSAAGIIWGSVSGTEFDATDEAQPFAYSVTYNSVKSLSNPYGSVAGGGPPASYEWNAANPSFLLPATVNAIARDFRWPFTYQMNFTIEREIANGLTVSVGYQGALGRNLPFTSDANYPVYGPGATSMNVDSRRPYLAGQLSAINLLQSNLDSSYHALQTVVSKRLAHGFLVHGSYTFAKSLDGAETQNETPSGGVQDARDLAAERGRTDNDRRNSLVFSGFWTYHKWTVSGIVTLSSGLPFTVTSGKDNNADGVNNDRANLIGDPYLDPNRPRSAVTNEWFNIAAFAQNGAGMDGTSGRNILDGPGFRDVDIGLFRDLRLRENIKLQFRVEASNALNLVSLGQPNSVLNSPAFGTIRSAQPMRQVQAGLRLYW